MSTDYQSIPHANVFGLGRHSHGCILDEFDVSRLSAAGQGLQAVLSVLHQRELDAETLNGEGVSFGHLLTSEYAADTVYIWLMSSVGLTGCLIWIIISWCQINFRKHFLQIGGDVKDLVFRTPLFPAVPIAAIIVNLCIIASLAFVEGQEIVLYTGIPVIAGIYLYYIFIHSKRDTELEQIAK